MKGFLKLEGLRYEIEQEIQEKQGNIKQLRKDMKQEKEEAQNLFTRDAVEVRYVSKIIEQQNELEHLKDKLKLINYCINTVFY